jgi:hypothetical protein
LANLTTILAKIRKNVIDLPPDTEDGLVGWVNEAQIVAEAYHQWLGLETTLTKDTTQGSPILDAKPANWLVAIGDPFYRTGTGLARPLEWYPSIEDLYKENTAGLLTTDQGTPKGIYETATHLLVYPPPDANNTLGAHSAAGEYEVLVPYRARAATLSVAGTISSFFTTDPDQELHLTDYASAQAMLFNRDIQNAQLYLAKASAHLLRAKRLDKKRKAQFIKITPRRDVHASRKQRRAV